MNLKDKVALITGGARMGLAVGCALASRGCRVAVTYRRSRQRAEDACRAVRALGREAIAFRVDLAEAKGARNAVSRVEKEWGRLDVLVPMASVYEKKPFGDLDAKYWDKNLNTNLKSAYDLALSAAPLMKRKGGGRIVHVADWTAASGRPRYKNYLPYYVSKAGLLGLTEVLALELAPEILVNAIAPGPILPPRGATKQELDEVEKSTPLRRWGRPEEIAKTVVFLAETDFVTGDCIRVDGGRHLY